MVRVMAKTFSLEDIIEYEVKRRLNEKGEEETLTGVLDLKGFIKILQYLIKLKEMELKHAQITAKAENNAESKQQAGINPDTVVNTIIEAIDFVLNNYGDVKISEVREIVINNKEMLKTIIAQRLRA